MGVEARSRTRSLEDFDRKHKVLLQEWQAEVLILNPCVYVRVKELEVFRISEAEARTMLENFERQLSGDLAAVLPDEKAGARESSL